LAKRRFLVLAAVYASFFILGMPDGAFGVAWPGIRGEMGMPLERAGILILVHSFFYSLTSAMLGRISRRARLEWISLAGIALMATGGLGMALSPGFATMAVAVAPLGVGMGMLDSSLNSYMVKSFSSAHLNWLHCFWGMGAAVTPVIMARIILASGWRAGYAAMVAAQVAVAAFVLATLLKGAWAGAGKGGPSPSPGAVGKKYLTKRRHRIMAVASCFLYGGAEYSVGFWVTSVLLETRGLGLDRVGIYPAVYFASITAGRMAFGFVADKFGDTAIIRLGYSLSVAGLAIMFLTGNIAGMALAGLGFAPIFPCLVHASSNRFDPKIVTRIVGYKVAAIGAGVAILSSLVGQLLSRVSLDALFPAAIVLATLTFLLNEILERNATA